jgi:hypothetical protein
VGVRVGDGVSVPVGVLVEVWDGVGVVVCVGVGEGRKVGVTEGVWLAAGSVAVGYSVVTGKVVRQLDKNRTARHPRNRRA